MAESNVRCSNCGEELDEIIDQKDDPPCPKCGSPRRSITISFTDKVQVKEQLEMKAKDPSYTGRAKIRIEQLVGDDLHCKSGKWYDKIRVIDRENNLYLETVKDAETGDVIHHCEEPLTEHFGHGSAKKKGGDT